MTDPPGPSGPSGAARPVRSHVRTPALWGLRLRRPLLHDGTAATAADAILRHANEASRVTERYRLLSPLEQRQLLAFLNSL